MLSSLRVLTLVRTGEKPHKNSVCALTSAIIDGTEVLFSSGYDGKILTWELTEKKTSNLASNVMVSLFSLNLGNFSKLHYDDRDLQSPLS